MTAQERQDAFIADLKDLLIEHGAELGLAYDANSTDATMEVCMPAVYEDNETVKPWCLFELPGYMP